MIISPLWAFTATPSTSMLTSFSAMELHPLRSPSGGLRSQGVADEAAAAVIDHVLELVAVVLEEALHGPRGRISEGADRMALDAVGDIEQKSQLLAARLARDSPLQHAVHPAGAFAARCALAARFGHVKARDALQGPHHAGGLVHHDGRAGAERRARRLDRIVVHVCL